ncbi:CheR family methyltransferase [Chitinasiproducens palmae]|uniref:protein-glutamate O-methyltransferase n=1 Tax=Chitinasiproducens palmae TaxID=1770053 RepID=A0A1H2PJS0_9BURK|nr:CheR family methyltransferase [Chitinasiproducens palmae]SDV46639.1 MCP methyltransferase, CheR-type [Chitinasiproducens palmae]
MNARKGLSPGATSVTSRTAPTRETPSAIGAARPSPQPGNIAHPVPTRQALSEAAAGAVRDFRFTDHDFERVRRLIYREAGISLSEAKRDMVYSRLARRLRALGLDDFGAYLDRLERDASEFEPFTNALTTNLTAFFRESHHFPVLADYAAALRRPLSIWCCAASTGEEPYSIAMTLVDKLGDSGYQSRILASDIDTAALGTASAGVYAADGVKALPTAQLQRHFLRGRGAHDGQVRVNDRLRGMIEFEQMNLVAERWQAASRVAPFDVIFCRNVMIYFDKPTQARILARFAPLLRVGGLMFAGHSENFSQMTRLFRLRGHTVYERVADASADRRGATVT